jgi:hypothetical protein
MELHYIISIALSALGLIGGFVSYVLGLRIKHDILVNNEKLEKEIQQVKDTCMAAVSSAKAEYLRELVANLDKVDNKHEKTARDLTDLQTNFTDRILNAINGKYVRIDLYQQTVSNIQERFCSMKELIEVNMGKIEQGLDRQILDLKDRIFHDKG